ncbi:MAG TPA: hypothetical protein VFM55_06470 [Micromonosporaceae bacterium]|nr:hypothetical protein [Micromonosporaceae bacterium]
MTVPTGSTRTPTGYNDADATVRPARPHGDETKPSWKTTELWVYLASVIAVLIATEVVGEGGDDYFRADRAWWYITLLTIGYVVSRGLAKSGSRSRDTDVRSR